MAIITKPSIAKGQAAIFSLSKSQLLQHPIVVADSYFSDSANWYRVNAVYKSSEGSQYEIVEFDAVAATPIGSFLVSLQARDSFLIQKLVILDFDGGFLEIPRSQLTVADFDISFIQPFFSIDFSQSISSLNPSLINGASISGGVLDLSSGGNFSFILPNPPFPTTGSDKYNIRVWLDETYPHSLMEGGYVYPLFAYKTLLGGSIAGLPGTQENLDKGYIDSSSSIQENLNAGNRLYFLASQGGYKITKIEFFKI